MDLYRQRRMEKGETVKKIGTLRESLKILGTWYWNSVLVADNVAEKEQVDKEYDILFREMVRSKK